MDVFDMPPTIVLLSKFSNTNILFKFFYFLCAVSKCF
jgi:hypothetical protein